MKSFFIYAGILVALYAAVMFFVMSKTYATPADKNAAMDLSIFVGLAALVALIVGGGAVMILWNRFVLNNTSISNIVWILAALCLVSMLWNGFKYGMEYLNAPKQSNISSPPNGAANE